MNQMTNPIKLVQKGDLNSLQTYLVAFPREESCKIVNAPDQHGDTLVHFSARFHRKDILALLIKSYGGNTMAVNEHGIYLSAASKKTKSLSSTLCLAQSKSGRLPIHTAALFNHPEVVFYFLETSNETKQFFLTSEDNGGADLLQNAVISKNLEMTKKLIEENSCDVNHKDKIGRSAIHHASMIGDMSVIRLLIEFGADLNISDDWDRWTPLHHACKEGNLEVVKYFINDCCADTSIRDKHGRDPKDV
ncbi:11363_t:CDS:2, partial [Acaulospora colombiana]